MALGNSFALLENARAVYRCVRQRKMSKTAEVQNVEQPAKTLTEEEKRRLEEKEKMEREWNEKSERLKKEREAEAKKLTLHQYEEKCQEKRKALEEKLKKFEEEKKTPEGLKPEERKVVIEREVKIIEKKKDEVFVQLKSDKLQRRNSHGKKDKVREPIIPNFQFRRPERSDHRRNNNDQGPDNRNGGRDYTRGGFSARMPEKEAKPEPKPAPKASHAPVIEDCGQFPALGGAPKA
ncbi:uncharacterized protein A4U43_C10F11910 [Asparagus officinalis]|uniref:Hyaluronan/mRNA-binding protein domain-containing protein n=2 Tax=Asparagus officinalis TaxID=4686 RepID=A0A5P1E2H5_ASPOF|nr:uncharacterized protein A4U43_C10F11910 [Asparagus officinalis]